MKNFQKVQTLTALEMQAFIIKAGRPAAFSSRIPKAIERKISYNDCINVWLNQDYDAEFWRSVELEKEHQEVLRNRK